MIEFRYYRFYSMDNHNEPNTTPVHQDLVNHLAHPENIEPVQFGRVCGDGRQHETDGKLARFGADGGYVLGLLALNKTRNLGFTVKQIVDATVRASIVDGTKFSLHTDFHEGPEPYAIGCGHLAKASLPENEEKYGVNHEEVREAIIYIKELAQKDPEHVEIVKLEGDHQERGVIFNMGKKKKIVHKRDHIQWFMVDEERDKEYVNNVLFPRLCMQLPHLLEEGIDSEEFDKVLHKQTLATARILAHGLDINKVNADGELLHIEHAGKVE